MTAAEPRGGSNIAAPALRVAEWSDTGGLKHGFFGRAGGVSQGELGSLNVSGSVGDDDAHVEANWLRVRAALSGITIVRMRQVHGTRVVRVLSAADEVGEADALVTDQPGLGLAVLTADCVPLLGIAAEAGVIMAAHAGWRGSLAGVAAVALALARETFGIAPSDWRIALGPSIGGCCYEVEAEIGDLFIDRWGAMPDAWQANGKHGQLDLRSANRSILLQQGVVAEHIITIGPCTACASVDYYSHRRSGGRAGRQVSAIGFAAAKTGTAAA